LGAPRPLAQLVAVRLALEADRVAVDAGRSPQNARSSGILVGVVWIAKSAGALRASKPPHCNGDDGRIRSCRSHAVAVALVASAT